MQILYGVQTTGNGHLCRSRLVISHLKRLGHDVHVLLSGAGDGKFWDHSILEPYTKYDGLTFVHNNGKINAFKTLKNLNLKSFYSDIWNFNGRRYDLVISDFEPISTRIAEKFNIKSIGISHQCAFIYKIPKAPLNYIGKIVTRMFAPVTLPIGLHWYHFNQSILPPIINHQLKCDLPIETNKILVYLPFENKDSYKQEFLKFPDYSFHIYEKSDESLVEQNLHWNPFSRENFINDLKSCNGVICQAGFELPSEAIHLGKKLLLKPVQGQYEQLCNVIAMDELGYGKTTKKFTAEVIQNWLDQPSPKSAIYPDVAKYVAQWISEDPSLSAELLSQYLWNNTEHPPMQLNFVMA